MTWKLGIVVVVVTVALAAVASPVSAYSESNWFGSELNVIQKVYDDCQNKNDIVGCLKGKALAAINKASEQESLSVLDGVTFVKQNETANAEDSPSIVEGRFLNGLSTVDKALISNLDRFFKTHVLKVDMAEARGKIQDKLQEIKEKRGKKKGGGGGGGGGKGGKKYGRYVMAALLTAMGIAGPLGLKALAAIAGKALVISKVALTIAGIIALKKIFQNDHHEETSFQVHSSGDHNRRNAYYVRQVKAAAAATPSQYVDPYRYYYEHYPQTTTSQ